MSKKSKKQWGSFPELTTEENREIRAAREAGFAVFYPAYPNAETQARDTLRGARVFMNGGAS